jgi:hypothetical protein
MNVIGKSRSVPVRKRDKKTGKLVAVTDAQGNVETKMVQDEVWRETHGTLGGHFGPDGKRKLVVGLCAGDVLVMYPKGTRQAVSIELKTVYSRCLRDKALRKLLEKANKAKASKQRRRQTRRLDYAEKKLRRPV